MSERAPRILLADDDAVALLVTQAALEAADFEVIAVEDGAMALQAFAAQHVDCAILDVVMPRVDGHEACRRIRSTPAGRDLPILIMTSRDDVEAVARAYEAGATDFTAKGISARLLIERVRFLLREYQSRRALVISQARLAVVQRMARIGHWEVDASGRTRHLARLVGAMLGQKAGGPVHLAHLVAALQPDDGQRVLAAFRRWQESRAEFRVEATLRSGVQLHIHGMTTPGGDETGRPTMTLAVQDISELRQAQREAHKLANFDVLTGLPNGRQFLDLLARGIRTRDPASPLWVLGFRLRGLERLQQSLGQAAADAALVAAGQVIHGAVRLREGDIFTHLGGGEYALCRPGCDSPAAAAAIAGLVAAAFDSPLSGEGWTVSLLVSAGIVSWPADADSAELLLEKARSTAARVLDDPESSFGFFSVDAQQHARRILELESGLHAALEKGELSVAFQPRFTLADRRIRGVEALLRWSHPVLGSISPVEFIPMAERTGLIGALGSWVLLEACRQVAAWRGSCAPDLCVSVNVSAHQVRSPRTLVEDVLHALKASELPPEALELELTESSFVDATEESLQALRELRSLGVTLALDDFGTGYSSLGYLRSLPVDCLKVDRSFVSDLPGEGDAERMLQAILGIAAALRLRTVAEGIETPAQFEALRQHGCVEGQGFLLARPLAVPDCEALLADEAACASRTAAPEERAAGTGGRAA